MIIQVFRIIGHLTSKILDFQSIIQVFQLDFDNLGLSIRKTWIITLINQDFRFIVHCTLKILDFQSIIQVFNSLLKILDFQIIGHLASKIQDFQLIIQVYRLDFDNLGLSIRKTRIFTLIIQVFRLIVQEKSKSWIIEWKSKIFNATCPISRTSWIIDID